MHARHDRTVINDDGRGWEYEPWRDGEFGPRNLARTFDEVSRQLNDDLARAHLAVDDEPQPQPPVDVGLLTEPDLSALISVDPVDLPADGGGEGLTLDMLRAVIDELKAVAPYRPDPGAELRAAIAFGPLTRDLLD